MPSSPNPVLSPVPVPRNNQAAKRNELPHSLDFQTRGALDFHAPRVDNAMTALYGIEKAAMVLAVRQGRGRGVIDQQALH